MIENIFKTPLKEIISLRWTTVDSWLHVPMAVFFWVVCIIPFLIFHPVIAAGLVASWQVYFREVTQTQSKEYDHDFRRGWNPNGWSRSKNIETWWPIGWILLISVVLYLFLTVAGVSF